MAAQRENQAAEQTITAAKATTVAGPTSTQTLSGDADRLKSIVDGMSAEEYQAVNALLAQQRAELTTPKPFVQTLKDMGNLVADVATDKVNVRDAQGQAYGQVADELKDLSVALGNLAATNVGTAGDVAITAASTLWAPFRWAGEKIVGAFETARNLANLPETLAKEQEFREKEDALNRKKVANEIAKLKQAQAQALSAAKPSEAVKPSEPASVGAAPANSAQVTTTTTLISPVVVAPAPTPPTVVEQTHAGGYYNVTPLNAGPSASSVAPNAESDLNAQIAALTPGGYHLDSARNILPGQAPAAEAGNDLDRNATLPRSSYGMVTLEKSIDTNRMQYVIAQIAEAEGANPATVLAAIKKFNNKLDAPWRGSKSATRLTEKAIAENGDFGPAEQRVFDMVKEYSRQRGDTLFRKQSKIELPEQYAYLHEAARETPTIPRFSRNEIAEAYAKKHGMTGEQLKQVDQMLRRSGGEAGKLQAEARMNGVQDPHVAELFLLKETGVLGTTELQDLAAQISDTRRFVTAYSRNANVDYWQGRDVPNAKAAYKEAEAVYGKEVARQARDILEARTPEKRQEEWNSVRPGQRNNVNDAINLIKEGKLPYEQN